MSEKIEIRGCRDKRELLSVIELCDKAFENTPYEYFERHLLKDKTLKPADTRILILNDEIVSAVQVFRRTMYFESNKIKFCGIGNVATLPDKRKLGYAELVLRDAISYMSNLNVEFSLLTTTINKYYEKFGYKTLFRELYFITDVPPVRNPNVRLFNYTRDFKRVKYIYEIYNQGSIGPIYRDDDYWHSQFNFCGEDPQLFLVLEQNNDIKSYIRAIKEINKAKLLEYASVSDFTTSFRILLEAISYQTGITNFEIFLSELEKQKLNVKYLKPQIDSDLMILFMKNKVSQDLIDKLMKYNNITFWLSDFF